MLKSIFVIITISLCYALDMHILFNGRSIWFKSYIENNFRFVYGVIHIKINRFVLILCHMLHELFMSYKLRTIDLP